MNQENIPIKGLKRPARWVFKDVEELKQELWELEREVEELEKEGAGENWSSETATLQEIQHAMSCLANMPNCDLPDEDTLDDEIGKLLKKNELMSTISGLTLTDTKTRILSLDKKTLKKKQVISGNCANVDFHLEIIIEQPQNVEGKSAKITSFVIDIRDWPIKEQLQPVVARLENELEVGRFFEVFTRFIAMFNKRKKMVELLKGQFPSDIRLSDSAEGQTLTVGRDKTGILWVIHWNIQVDKDFVVSNDAYLKVKDVGKPGRKKINIDGVPSPEQFSEMVKKYGVEKAIELFIQEVPDFNS